MWVYARILLLVIFHSSLGILQGDKVTKGFDYMVHIRIETRTSTGTCGGAILNKKIILSAAHCFVNVPTTHVLVTAGSFDRECPLQRLSVNYIKRPPGYRKKWEPSLFDRVCNRNMLLFSRNNSPELTPPFYDIALLMLNEALQFGELIKPIPYSESDIIPEGQRCEFAGWGVSSDTIKMENAPASNDLLWTRLKPFSRDTRINQHRRSISEDRFAVSVTTVNSTLTLGDSGSPLVCNGVIVGIASTSSCRPNGGAVFTDVSYYKDWLNETLEKRNFWLDIE